MKNEFVSYEAAVELKQLGFDEPCFGYYRLPRFGYYGLPNEVLCGEYEMIETQINFPDIKYKEAPLYQQAFRFLREEYGDLLLPEYGRVPHFTIISNLVLQDGLPIEESESICLQQMIQCVKSRSTNFNSIPL